MKHYLVGVSSQSSSSQSQREKAFFSRGTESLDRVEGFHKTRLLLSECRT